MTISKEYWNHFFEHVYDSKGKYLEIVLEFIKQFVYKEVIPRSERRKQVLDGTVYFDDFDEEEKWINTGERD